jgi:hypothetical protein
VGSVRTHQITGVSRPNGETRTVGRSANRVDRRCSLVTSREGCQLKHCGLRARRSLADVREDRSKTPRSDPLALWPHEIEPATVCAPRWVRAEAPAA